jgi:hypothetical protein
MCNSINILDAPVKNWVVGSLVDWSLANAEKGGGELTETRFLSLLRNVAVA